MVSAAVTQALTSLVPSYPASSKPFPPALLSQCDSLLALSRQRAQNLKPDEEIARAHACCEIACKRTRAQLRLPAIKSGVGAPCKPRTYNKLIGFLEGILADAPIGTLTPKGRKRDADGTIKESGGNSTGKSRLREQSHGDETPSKKRFVDKTPTKGFAGTVKSGHKVNGIYGSIEGNTEAPDFIMPAIRKLCKALSTPQLAPHVYTGTCVVSSLAQIWPPTDDEHDETDNLKTDMLSLLTAIFLMVLTRMRKGAMTTELYAKVLDRSLTVLDLNGDNDITSKVEEWIGRLNSENWCNGQDWWESVPEDVLVLKKIQGTRTTEVVVASEDDGEEEDNLHQARRDRKLRNERAKVEMEQDDPDGVLLPGLGTMLHDGIDWLSDDRKSDYQMWKADILRKMDAMDSMEGRKGKAIGVR